MWSDLAWAAQCPDASKVDVALLLNIGQLQSREDWLAIVQRIIVVPLVSIRVREYGNVWDSVVVVDYVAAFLLGPMIE